MAKARLDLKGFEAYLEAIAQAGKDVDASASKALLAGAKPMQAEMEALAPEDKGNLKAHIQIDGPYQDGNYHYIEVGLIGKSSLTDADTMRYGLAQEYGTSSMQAHPYIRPGKDRARAKVRAEMRKSLEEDGVL
jgi:HK97 gp10 family phage protein